MAADYLPSHQHVEAGRNYISQEVWSPGPRQVSELKQDEGRKKIVVFHQAFLMRISNALILIIIIYCAFCDAMYDNMLKNIN